MNLLGLFLLLFLTACTSIKNSSDTLTSFPSCTNSEATEAWELTGALAFKNKDGAWSAGLSWQQQDMNHYRMQLFGPLGSGAVILEKAGKQFRYQDNRRHMITTNIEALIEKKTAVRIPVEMLFYWIRGLPAPGVIQGVKYNQEHSLAILQQAGFTVHYISYMAENQVDLPHKIHLTGNGIDIKLIIKQWKLDCKKA